MQFWPGVRPNQRQRALGNYLYRATVGRTLQRYGQRVLDRYGNTTVSVLKRLGSAAGALPGKNSTKMAYMKYGSRTRRKGGARKRWVRRSYVGRKRRRGPMIPSSLRRYITKMANSGKEKLHVSYAGTVPSSAHAPQADGASSIWAHATSMSEMGAFVYRKSSDNPTGDDQVNPANTDNLWSFGSIPLFSGDYIFIKKTTCTFDITLNDIWRNYSDIADSSSAVRKLSSFPWIVRMIVYKPKDSLQDEGNELFRTLNGDKVGFQTYRNTTVASELTAQQDDARHMITKGLVNKADFRIVKDIRFQLGSGEVAGCVSKKVPITFTFNRNEKILDDTGGASGVVINLADADDTVTDNARRSRYYDYRFAFFAVPTIPNMNLTSTSPINVTFHGVTTSHD